MQGSSTVASVGPPFYYVPARIGDSSIGLGSLREGALAPHVLLMLPLVESCLGMFICFHALLVMLALLGVVPLCRM